MCIRDRPETPGGAEGFTQSMEYVGDVIAGAPDGGECLVRLKNRFYVGDALEAVSYTHLDVYKRQVSNSGPHTARLTPHRSITHAPFLNAAACSCT